MRIDKLCSENMIDTDCNNPIPQKQKFNIRKSRSIMNLGIYDNIEIQTLRDKIFGVKQKQNQNQFQNLIDKAQIVKKDQKGQISTLAFVIDNQSRKRNQYGRSSNGSINM